MLSHLLHCQRVERHITMLHHNADVSVPCDQPINGCADAALLWQLVGLFHEESGKQHEHSLQKLNGMHSVPPLP